MANTFNLEELESGQVYEQATVGQKDYAYSLLYSSAYNDEQKSIFDDELSDDGLSTDRLDEIIYNLQMNQSESPNPNMTEIKQQLAKRLEREE